MKLERLEMVSRIVAAREALLGRLAVLDTWGPDVDCGFSMQPAWCITIGSNRLDSAMLALARPVLQRELRAQIKALEADLAGLGVEV